MSFLVYRYYRFSFLSREYQDKEQNLLENTTIGYMFKMNSEGEFSMSNERKRCFVIMPFSETTKFHTEEYWSNHFENFLKPLIESCSGIEAFRSVPLRQDIVRQIINDLVFSPIVVADLTDSNPNVYWELGVRLSFRHGTITIAEETSEIPFDIKTKGVLFYDSEPNNRDEFSSKFKEALNDCITNPNRPDSVVLETITGRTSIYSVIHHQEIIRKINGLIAETEHNYKALELIYERIDWNESRRLSSLRTSWGAITTSLGTSALDLLLAERYIEEEPEFYSDAHGMLFLTNSINEILSAWTHDKNASNWFVEKKFYLKNSFKVFHEKIIKIREKFLSKC